MDSQTLWENINYYFKEFILFKIQDVGITISHLAVAVVAVILSMLLSKVVRSTLSRHVFNKLDIDKGLQYALLRFVHYVILIIGVYIGLKTVNIPLGAIVGLFAVIGVGIGFGLQNLASNFISGVILLLERPIKIGDRLEFNDVWGDVKRINLRTTLIQTPDNVAIIVPNSKLLENEVINYSYGDPKIRLQIPVGIAYGSDCDMATKIMIGVARDNGHVMEYPKPKVWFREFGDSSLNFILLCWIPDVVSKFDVVSEINYSIDRAFRDNKIEIPFPQRDLHLRSAEALVRFSTDPQTEQDSIDR
ncbi:MAG TPA: mechanosensitive ion channel domain-containing protein [Geopsychrobacteraceae bacterium]|nr:mechanosensitive ion channel domain-containing protein [Geopsychrobacteraceae bacterium]